MDKQTKTTLNILFPIVLYNNNNNNKNNNNNNDNDNNNNNKGTLQVRYK